ncbi:LysR substrate-binding domain-containing protein [Bradyrhizobium sp. LA6.7]|uniref:LysR substrate-binding domain-containing protein n=1 Tax=unclassified Bradyrhizobium TaxID=2631580 RepID=UPI0033934A3A
MDIRELRYFTHVARAGSFSRAAANLNVAQPALSRQVKQLEQELGVQLFERTQRGVELTKAGSLLFSQAEDIIEHLARTLDLVRSSSDAFAGHVALGLAPTSGLLIAPEIFGIFKSRWPHATLVIREGVSSSLEEWLQSRRVDIAVLHNPTPLDGIDMLPILHERMVLISAYADGAEAAKGVRFKDLSDVPLILPSLPHSNRRLLERAAIQHNSRLNLALEVDSVPLTKAMVKAGFASTIMTFAGAALEVERKELIARPIERPPLISNICIGMPREARLSWLTMELGRLLRSCITKLVTQGSWPAATIFEGAANEFHPPEPH